MCDPVGRIDLGHFAALSGLFQRCRSFFQAAIAAALNCVSVLMDLEKRQTRGLVASFEHVSLSVVEKKVKSTAGSFPYNSYSGLTKVLGAGHFGGEQASIQMRLQARLPSTKGAFLPRFRQAHRAPHGQYLSRRKFFGDYHVLSDLAGLSRQLRRAAMALRARLRREFQNPLRPPGYVGDSVRGVGE